MKNFKRKSIYLALATGLFASGLASAAHDPTPDSGVFVNSDGTGQVLLYPYYTTRGGMDTYVSLVNTTGMAKAVKVRFVEGKNSREVLDFNLYLSPYDMWTGAVVNTSNGAKLETADKSCTTPKIPAAGKEFVNYAYNGSVGSEDVLYPGINIGGKDGESQSLDRTREGYIEIIEMGEILDNPEEEKELYDYILHVNGVPGDCDKVQTLNDLEHRGNFVAPGGGLTGTASLVAPGSGTDFSYDPVAIDNFHSDGSIWHQAGSIEPDLRHGTAKSVVFWRDQVVTSDWVNTGEYEDDDSSMDSVNAVNAILMKHSIINEFVLDNVTLSGTDWVVTMPTKRYSVPIKDPDNRNHDDREPLPPFTSTFWKDGACESVKIEYYDREEISAEVKGFSPPPPTDNALCWEANVITFRDSNILGSVNSVNIPISEGFQNGWMRMHFDGAGQRMDNRESPSVDKTHTYYGLPVIGFMVQDFVNLNANPGVMATYGGSFKHKYETCIDGNGVHSPAEGTSCHDRLDD